jgi:hypothetical protein
LQQPVVELLQQENAVMLHPTHRQSILVSRHVLRLVLVLISKLMLQLVILTFILFLVLVLRVLQDSTAPLELLLSQLLVGKGNILLLQPELILDALQLQGLSTLDVFLMVKLVLLLVQNQKRDLRRLLWEPLLQLQV